MRVAIYINVSKSAGPQVPLEQLRQMRAMIEQEGWKPVRVYQDAILSKCEDRPALQRMVRDAERRQFDFLLFWALNRLSSGGALSTVPIFEKLFEAGVGFRCFTHPSIDSHKISMTGLKTILTRITKAKHAELSERTKAGLAMSKEIWGVTPGRPKTKFDTEKAKRLREKGRSYAKIAEACNVAKAIVYRFFREEASR